MKDSIASVLLVKVNSIEDANEDVRNKLTEIATDLKWVKQGFNEHIRKCEEDKAANEAEHKKITKQVYAYIATLAGGLGAIAAGIFAWMPGK